MRNYLKEYNQELTLDFERTLITESHTSLTVTIPVLLNGEESPAFATFKGEDAEQILKNLKQKDIKVF